MINPEIKIVCKNCGYEIKILIKSINKLQREILNLSDEIKNLKSENAALKILNKKNSNPFADIFK